MGVSLHHARHGLSPVAITGAFRLENALWVGVFERQDEAGYSVALENERQFLLKQEKKEEKHRGH